MITLLILLIILIPACFLIYKVSAEKWAKAEAEEEEQIRYKKELEDLEKDQLVQGELNDLQTHKRRRMAETNGERQ